jgi:hypothetical protein
VDVPLGKQLALMRSEPIGVGISPFSISPSIFNPSKVIQILTAIIIVEVVLSMKAGMCTIAGLESF